jgi:hypothetical protein
LLNIKNKNEAKTDTTSAEAIAHHMLSFGKNSGKVMPNRTWNRNVLENDNNPEIMPLLSAVKNDEI